MDSSVDPPFDFSMGDHRDKEESAHESHEQALVNDLVSKNKVVVFSKTHCPHCSDSKTLLTTMGVNYKTVELDKLQEGGEVQNVLGQMTDARTVPRIFISGQCVGGNSDLKTLNASGELQDLLKDL
ncbi:glutaredoxin [Aplysia californica]|uniref:Glutaredoxin n=1 Tax=Aplysia californica TaxID=6500 RepID=A0ABM0JGA1_APLCA|nr:glutaredoxin [Aplysia californica]